MLHVHSAGTAIMTCLLFSQQALAQSTEERVASLTEHAIAVRTIDPEDEDFSDLGSVRNLLRSVRVVLLGEQTHGDGATFFAKARLVKFLHQEMGFDVLAFESGFYDCEKAEAQLELGESADAAFELCVFPIWTQSAQVQPTIEYLEATRRGERPLRLAGFDSQMTGSASRQFLAGDLREVAENVGSSFDWMTFGDIVEDLAQNKFGLGQSPLPDEEVREALDGALAGLGREIEMSSHSERGFWTQVVRSVRSHLDTVYAMDGDRANLESVTIRDRQMAENLLWLLDHRYPDQKVIVWAATGHNARNLSSIRDESGEVLELYQHWLPMGDHLHERLGGEMYSVGFIAHEGEWGVPWWEPTTVVSPGDPGSLEAMLTQAGFEFAFVDLRDLERSTGWLRQPVQARPLGYSPMIAPWGDVVDGFFFTRAMTPSTRRTTGTDSSRLGTP